MKKECSKCGGTGLVEPEESAEGDGKCPECDGLGEVEVKGAPASDTKQKRVFDWSKPRELPPTWEPEEGEVIEGRIAKLSHVTLGNREAHFMNIETQDGVKTVWLKRVIKGYVDENHIQAGDIIGIKYLGKEANVSGVEYDNYDIRSAQTRE